MNPPPAGSRPDVRRPRRAITSSWGTDPQYHTAYSYLRGGGSPADRERLARPIRPGLLYAGEAASSRYPGTMHGAWFSGEQAAEHALAETRRGERIVVIGAGLAGLAAARRLHAQREVVVLEAEDNAGGRLRTSRALGGPAHLGASWIHGIEGNPITKLAADDGMTLTQTRWDRAGTYLAGDGRLTSEELERFSDTRDTVADALAREAARAPLSETVGPIARRLIREHTAPGREALVVGTWIRSEYEGLYAAAIDDLSLVHRAEPFRMRGTDAMLTGDLTALATTLAEPFDVRYRASVRSVEQERARSDGEPSSRWRITWHSSDAGGELSIDAGAVIVTVAIGVVQRGLIRFSPGLPDDVLAALSRLGAGRVAKAFFSFDTPFWSPHAVFWVVAERPRLGVFIDMSELIGRPALCSFVGGAAAERIERMTEAELCQTAAEVLGSIDFDT